MKIKVGFIGFGRMGSALAAGAIRAGVLKPKQILAFDVDAKAKQVATANFYSKTIKIEHQ